MLDTMRGLPDAVNGDRQGGREFVLAIVGGVRLPADVARALPMLALELPGAVRDLRLVLRNLTRLTDSDGELTRYLREHARLAAAHAGDAERSAGSRTASGRGTRRSQSSSAKGGRSA